MSPLLRLCAALGVALVVACGRDAPLDAPEAAPEPPPSSPVVATYSQVQTDRMKWAPPRAATPDAPTPAPPIELTELDPDVQALGAPPSPDLAGLVRFESTYLGGDALHELLASRLDGVLAAHGRPHRLATAARQPLDAPAGAALGLSVNLDRAWTDGPSRVVLQVGLRGADLGPQRPPMALGLVLLPGPGDGEALADAAAAVLGALRADDRVSVVIAGPEPELVTRPERPESAARVLARALEAPAARGPVAAQALSEALYLSGRLLEDAPAPRVALRSVLVVGAGGLEPDAADVDQAAEAATHLTRFGVTTSVVELSSTGPGRLWRLASAGRGAFRATDVAGAEAALAALVEQLGRVVARDLRLEIRLEPGHRLVRVLGSPLLAEAGEAAASPGASALETRIPAFMAGDDHVVLVELDVAGPGAVAQATLTWADVSRQRPGVAQVAAALGSTRTPETAAQRLVRKNARGVALAEHLARAAEALRHGEVRGGARLLKAARKLAQATTRADLRMVDAFYHLLTLEAWVSAPDHLRLVSDALLLASRRKLGHPAAQP